MLQAEKKTQRFKWGNMSPLANSFDGLSLDIKEIKKYWLKPV